MTTRLVGTKTFFLPFNRGSHPGEVQCGEGNPQHPSGYRTGYFWEKVLGRESFLDTLGNFVFIEKKEEKVDDGKGGRRMVTREAMIFPRYHQLDATRKLIAAARAAGVGQNYLIQHSAGSGKTKEEKAPLSEIIEVLNNRFGTNFNEEDRLFFEQIKKNATNNPEVVRLRQANLFDNFQLGLRRMLEDLMIQRMGENDRIVTRYMDDKAFADAAFAVLSRVNYDSIPNIIN